MQEILKLREWVEQQCLLGNPLSCADMLNKIDEILEYDETDWNQKQWLISIKDIKQKRNVG